MSNFTITPEQLEETFRAVETHGSQNKAAKALGIARSTIQHRMMIAERNGKIPGKKPEFEWPLLPEPLRPVEDLIAERKAKFAHKKKFEEATKLIQVKVNIEGPFGIIHLGDPHVDDDGTDIALLERHVELSQTVVGLWLANIGDVSNNWVGRLARLYAEQSTSAPEAWQLAEWLIVSGRYIYLIGGNHDGWSGAGDPLKWMKTQGGATYMPSETRIALNCPNGQVIRVNARHDFDGASMWNPAHGVGKAIQMGVHDHITVAGHKHVAAHIGPFKCPTTGISCHGFRIASYKIFDRYAKERGFRDQNVSPCVMTVINPELPPTHPDLVTHFWDPEEGADYLNFKRKKF